MKPLLLIVLLLCATATLAQNPNPGVMELYKRVTGYASELPPKGNTATPAQAKAIRTSQWSGKE